LRKCVSYRGNSTVNLVNQIINNECIVRQIAQKKITLLYSDMMIRNMKVIWKFHVITKNLRKITSDKKYDKNLHLLCKQSGGHQSFMVLLPTFNAIKNQEKKSKIQEDTLEESLEDCPSLW